MPSSAAMFFWCSTRRPVEGSRGLCSGRDTPHLMERTTHAVLGRLSQPGLWDQRFDAQERQLTMVGPDARGAIPLRHRPGSKTREPSTAATSMSATRSAPPASPPGSPTCTRPSDPSLAAVLTVIGGYNSNELLPFLDWELIRANPKILCGYSDITAVQNAILARAGLVTYSGPLTLLCH
ncbi:LD-carboxypeptidase [Nonomuraea sp. 3-1Str]|uniref:LD-carboxypeptidase n=1 Tax=Nonomuraea sp. 3-1Str TaxID=2929801 RepID=UPI00285BB4BA|nr:LD-carboxypeptidase [Nonomuraea sp. 3-1Str]MDR8413242.1 LD-carboxypeptidase [Nonomuraea sp. 3-1Str]